MSSRFFAILFSMTEQNPLQLIFPEEQEYNIPPFSITVSRAIPSWHTTVPSGALVAEIGYFFSATGGLNKNPKAITSTILNSLLGLQEFFHQLDSDHPQTAQPQYIWTISRNKTLAMLSRNLGFEVTPHEKYSGFFVCTAETNTVRTKVTEILSRTDRKGRTVQERFQQRVRRV